MLLDWKPGRTAADCYSYFLCVKTNLILGFLVSVAGFTHVLAKQSINSLLPITCFQMFLLNILQKPGFNALLDCSVQHCITAIYLQPTLTSLFHFPLPQFFPGNGRNTCFLSASCMCCKDTDIMASFSMSFSFVKVDPCSVLDSR